MVVNCGLTFDSVYTNLSLHLMIFPFVSTWPRPLRPAAATATGLRSFSVDMPTQTEDKQGISVCQTAFVAMKRPSCLCERASKGCGGERDGVRFCGNNGRFVRRGDNVGRQVRTDQTLHRPSILLLPSTSAFSPLLHLQELTAAAASIVLLCKVGVGGGATHGCSTKQTSTMATPTDRRSSRAVWLGQMRWGTDGQKAPFARGGGSYVVSGSGGLPGTFLSQQVFDRVLDPDALVDPLGIIWNTETGGESPEQSGNSSPHFPQTSRHLNAPQF